MILQNNLANCGQTDNKSSFCKSCYKMIVKKKISKFGSANCINIFSYQNYLNVFTDLISVKRIFIIWTYLVILIIK